MFTQAAMPFLQAPVRGVIILLDGYELKLIKSTCYAQRMTDHQPVFVQTDEPLGG